MTKRIPFGITVYGQYAIINLRCKLNDVEFDALFSAYSHQLTMFKHKGGTFINGILPLDIYNNCFYPDFKIALHLTKAQVHADAIERYQEMKDAALSREEINLAL